MRSKVFIIGLWVFSMSASLAENIIFVGAKELVITQRNMQLMHEYGSFNLYQLDTTDYSALAESVRNNLTVVKQTIDFDALHYNPDDGLSMIPAKYRLDGDQVSGESLHLVRFVGPIKQQWLERVEKTGARLVHYVRNNAYLIWTDENSRLEIAKLTLKKNIISADIPYQPYFKMGKSIEARISAFDLNGINPDETVKISFQLIKHPANTVSRQLIDSKKITEITPWHDILSYQNISVEIAKQDLLEIINRPDVFSALEYFERELTDEVQGQIIAGNLNVGNTGPSGTGYLLWLQSHGFSTNPNDYPIVDVVDDGIGDGNTAAGAGDITLTQNGLGVTTRLNHISNCTAAADGSGIGGHGHINVSIVGGYDQRAGFPFRDPNGYQRGEGINPYGRMGGTRIFGPGFNLSACGGTDTGLIQSQQDNGSLISNNSWGCGACAGSYDSSSQAFDVGVRDADLTEAGNQQLIMIFSAGNDGSVAGTIGSPGNGKNMITVGASENPRPTDENGNWTDGCAIGPAGANSAMDVIAFSSRGPAPGGRVKPEIIAPGTHIQGTASTHAGYNGSSVCDQFAPSGQTDFASSSGTSHSGPAIAGLSSLYYYWLQNTHSVATPSPSLMKAYMIAHPTYLTGVGANGSLPSNSQGYGMPNMEIAFDNAARVIINESQIFDNTGESWTWSGQVADNSRPVRLVLAYTDAAGATGTSPEVNDLNLSAVISGSAYLGNNFTGEFSVAGGGADADNNYEAIFLAAGVNGAIDITVTAANIAGNGIPNFGDGTDQDFSLVCYNCTQTPDFSMLVTPPVVEVCINPGPVNAPNVTVDTTAILGFSNNITLGFNPALPTGFSESFSVNPVSPGNNSILTLTVDNTAAAGTHNLVVEGVATGSTKQDTLDVVINYPLSVSPSVTVPADGDTGVVLQPNFSWSAIAGASAYDIDIATDVAFSNIVDTASTVTNSYITGITLSVGTIYYWRVRASNFCGDAAYVIAAFETLTSGASSSQCNNPGVAIPDGNVAGVSNVMNIAGGGVLTDLDFTMNITHTWVGDLIVTLTNDSTATSAVVFDRPGVPASTFGCSGNNIDTTLDDAAASPVENQCAGGLPTIAAGPFSPNNPLSAFNGENSTGNWTINVSDNATPDPGTLNQWCLVTTVTGSVTPADYSDLAGSYGVARHIGGGTSRLGINWTADNSFSQDSDVADDDGIVASGMWVIGSGSASIAVTSTGGYLACWFDWNNDGGFQVSEQSIGQTVINGSENISVAIPGGSTFGSNGDDFLESRCRFYLTEPLRATETATGEAPTGEVEDYRLDANTFTPITLAFSSSLSRNSSFDLNWSTSTEAGSIGFNIYGQNQGLWKKLNNKPIPAKGINSVISHDYSFSVNQTGYEAYQIEELSSNGTKIRYGPFVSNLSYGKYPDNQPINWQAISAESDNKKQQRQLALRSQNNTVLVQVNNDGIQRISYQQLVDLGVDWQGVSADQIALSFEGKPVARFIPGMVFGLGGYIDFIGKTTKTLYSKSHVYQLSLLPVSAKPAMVFISDDLTVDPDAYYMASVGDDSDNKYSFAAAGNEPWFNESMLVFTDEAQWQYSLDAANLLNNGVAAQFDFTVWGGTDFPANIDHHLQLLLNGQMLDEYYFDGLEVLSDDIILDPLSIQPQNTVTFRLPADTGVDYDLIQLDSYSLTYPSALVATNNSLQFKPVLSGQINNPDVVFVDGFELNQTNTGLLVKGFSQGSGMTAYASDGNDMYSFTIAVNQVTANEFEAVIPYISENNEYFISLEQNIKQPDISLAGTPGILLAGQNDHLIITHPDFKDTLNPLVQYREAQGINVFVADVEDIYAIYSNYKPDADAIAEYIQDASAQMGISSVLLVGGDSYDYYDNLGLGSFSFIPTLYRQTDQIVRFAPVDPLFADIDGDEIPDLALGRLPVRTEIELQNIITKIINFADRQYTDTAIFASDRNPSFDRFSDQMIVQIPQGWLVEKAYISQLELSGAQSKLIQSIESGVTLTSFFGHSGPNSWSFERLFDSDDVLALNNIGKPTVVNQFGCWNTYYVMPELNTMAHSFMGLDNRGAVAVMGAATLTESFHEAILGNLLIPKITQQGVSIGEAIKLAKIELAADYPEYKDVILGWTLLGDPLMILVQ